MNKITEKKLKKKIHDCDLHNECGICKLYALPCYRVIEKELCDTIKEFFWRERFDREE